MRLATVGIGGSLGLIPRVVAEVGDSQSGTPRLVDVTAAGELWWADQGSGDAARWAVATFPPN